ncbi:hypothetical protein PILCRDRAFT_817760 [Piloderma croceum F 1598]|uniref:Uncharacterized protein n=1 Tax=Piloderma croceum (strain F 1598) TaxID=765440 RepID=A0A0C3FLK2_PILCF|nr:hypothetical protein PILCRDRAFT_817760 [Piloderma croceum F 1598]
MRTAVLGKACPASVSFRYTRPASSTIWQTVTSSDIVCDCHPRNLPPGLPLAVSSIHTGILVKERDKALVSAHPSSAA